MSIGLPEQLENMAYAGKLASRSNFGTIVNKNPRDDGQNGRLNSLRYYIMNTVILSATYHTAKET